MKITCWVKSALVCSRVKGFMQTLTMSVCTKKTLWYIFHWLPNGMKSQNEAYWNPFCCTLAFMLEEHEINEPEITDTFVSEHKVHLFQKMTWVLPSFAPVADLHETAPAATSDSLIPAHSLSLISLVKPRGPAALSQSNSKSRSTKGGFSGKVGS